MKLIALIRSVFGSYRTVVIQLADKKYRRHLVKMRKKLFGINLFELFIVTVIKKAGGNIRQSMFF